MALTLRDILQIRSHDKANQNIGELITIAEAVALLSGAVQSGIIDAISKGNTIEEVASTTNQEPENVKRILSSLEAFGLVKHRNGVFCLSKELELLNSPETPQPLDIMLRVTNIRMNNFLNIGRTTDEYTVLQAEDVLSVAKSIISALSFARDFVGIAIGRLMPELRHSWEAGGRHLESGCGAGNTLFEILTNYPNVTGVGIEIQKETANEAIKRAEYLGITDRVEIRQMDACTLTEEAVFDTAQWSQFFFPKSTRMSALDALYKAMKPGGYVFSPLLLNISTNVWEYRRDMLITALKTLRTEPMLSLVFFRAALLTNRKNTREEKRLETLQKIAYESWEIPATTAEKLKLEYESAGFDVLRAIPTPASRLFPSRGFLLAQRPVS